MPLPNIKIDRYETDPTAQGVVRPDHDRWQLVIDKDGYPHLYLEVHVEKGEGNLAKGLLCLDDMLPEGMSIRDLMDGGAFGGSLTPEEEDAASKKYAAKIEAEKRPCPR